MTIRSKYFGYTINESINSIANELDIDIVGLWQIIPVGEDSFDLKGEELEEFIRNHIVALLEKGAIPLRYDESQDIWIHQRQYGSDKIEIANKIIGEWRSSEMKVDVGGIWFGLPEMVDISDNS